MAEPASAAKFKLIDKGHKSVYDDDFGNGTMYWKTYKKGKNYVKMISHIYYPQIKKTFYYTLYLEKVSKSKLKTVMKMKFFGKTWKKSFYQKMPYSAVYLYWAGKDGFLDIVN